MRRSILILMLMAGAAAAQVTHQVRSDEPVVGGRCEGCEAVFQGLPDALESSARLAPEDEPGEPLRLTGTVVGPDAQPAPGIVIYAYQTDAEGIYRPLEDPPGAAARRHGVLRAWVETDAKGRYEFLTVRPGSYPETSIAQHIHLHVIEPGRCTYYIADVEFTDDPLIPKDAFEKHARGRGGPGLVTPVKDDAGVWQVERDIFLGMNVPDYPDPPADR